MRLAASRQRSKSMVFAKKARDSDGITVLKAIALEYKRILPPPALETLLAPTQEYKRPRLSHEKSRLSRGLSIGYGILNVNIMKKCEALAIGCTRSQIPLCSPVHRVLVSRIMHG